ncbi:hypothetical protein CYMTET_40637 [Cymbomonas tetramitiformis]|uniref:Nucleotide-diphospho-sugar transferase domain-containing protein n=1 Tax=Cymbomonas tetramitiformis TaxID=36881 RepID=A0AAE0F4F4_9CHLO|nr:hypothetical protein CYMTET_40637 [Cymbomonas tetramitiformis]
MCHIGERYSSAVKYSLCIVVLFALLLQGSADEPKRKSGPWELHLPTLFSESGKADVVRAEDIRSGRAKHPQLQPRPQASTTSSSAQEVTLGEDKAELQRELERLREENAKLKQSTTSTKDSAVDLQRLPRKFIPADTSEEHADEHTQHYDWADLGEGDDTLASALRGLEPGTAVIVTFADAEYIEMLQNWVAHCRRAGMGPLVVGAMDVQVLAEAKKLDVRTFNMDHTIKSFGFGAQIGIIEGLMELGYDVLMSDVDTAWIKDPMPYFVNTEARRRANLLISSDCASCLADEEKGLCIHAPYNIGIMMWRRGEVAQKLLAEWVNNLRGQGKVGYMAEQLELNEILRGKDGKRMFPLEVGCGEGNGVRVRGAVHVSRTPYGPFNVAMLPAGQFTHGHIFFVAEVPQRLQLDVYVVHATYQFGNGRTGQALGKKQRFREHGLWLVDNDLHYDQKFITYSSVIPAEWHEGTEPGFQRHMKTVEYHMKNMRNGLAIAKALGRVLVPPRWECHCDRHWTPILPGCIMANSDLKLPFHCPMDHLFEVMSWEHEERIAFREPGLLESPRFAALGDQSRAYISVPDDPEELAFGAGNQSLRWPRGATDIKAREFVKENKLEDVRVLEFTSTANAFCGFEDADTSQMMNSVMMGRGGNRGSGILNSVSWCCDNLKKDVGGYQPTPVPYQMPGFFDTATCQKDAALLEAKDKFKMG